MSMAIPQQVDLRHAMRLANDRLALAQGQLDPFSMCHALTQVARCYKLMGMLAETQTCLQQALRWSRLMGGTDGVVDLLCELGETAATLAATHAAAHAATLVDTRHPPRAAQALRQRARGHALEASTLACHVSDPQCEAQVLLRISDILDRCGNRDDAVLLQTRALRLMADPAQAEAMPDPHLMPGIGRLADG